MSDRLVLVDDKKNIIAYGLKNYSKELEKNKNYKTVKLKDFGWKLIVKRGGTYVRLGNEKDIMENDIVCCRKKKKIIVYRGGNELNIDKKDLLPGLDHIIRPLSKNELEDNDGKVKIKE